MRERKRARAAECMPRQECDRRVREVEDRGEHGVEAVCVCEGVAVCFVELEACAEEFVVGAAGDYGAGGGGAQGSLDVVVGGDYFAAEGAV